MRRSVKIALVTGFVFIAPLVAYAEKNNTLQLLDLFGEVFDRVRSDYVEETKDSDLIEAAINGMIMPTARSSTLPRAINFLNSLSISTPFQAM